MFVTRSNANNGIKKGSSSLNLSKSQNESRQHACHLIRIQVIHESGKNPSHNQHKIRFSELPLALLCMTLATSLKRRFYFSTMDGAPIYERFWRTKPPVIFQKPKDYFSFRSKQRVSSSGLCLFSHEMKTTHAVRSKSAYP